MRIAVIEHGKPIRGNPNCIVLHQDRWDDYGYRTAFYAYYFDSKGNKIKLGWVKIGKIGLAEGSIVANILPSDFDCLDEAFFSLGQGREYYEAIAALGDSTRVDILDSLRDIAYCLELFMKVEGEEVTRVSLLRGINKFSVINQFHRIAEGGVALTRYSFSYTPNGYDDPLLTFEVTPNSKPPSNIHVLIGRNGTGKTTLLRNIVHALYCDDGAAGEFTYEQSRASRSAQSETIANVLCVSFSPFDNFPKKEEGITAGKSSLPYSYIGLDITTNNISEVLISQLVSAINNCKNNKHKSVLLRHAIDNLISDPAFASSGIIDLLKGEQLDDGKTIRFFRSLSSGHKMVLLTVLCCVEKIEERSLLIMDEPENHLHPPLLSALIRTLSNILIDRNGVGIIATHSPVILQEVPRRCVWTLRRAGEKIISERPNIETFGSNVGSLTSEVFGLEVQKSGFIRMLEDSIDEGRSYEEVVDEFGGQLGIEAQIILKALVFNRSEEPAQ